MSMWGRAIFNTLMAGAVVAGAGRVSAQAAAGVAGLHVSAALTAGEAKAPVLREIKDPSSGTRWLLLADPAHPGGPGRLVAVGGEAPAAAPKAAGAEALKPIVRAGDRVVIEEHSSVVNTRLEAVALEPAGEGAVLQARLKFGGKVMRVIVTGPGRAVIAPQQEIRQ